jgi:hypothetical protein
MTPQRIMTVGTAHHSMINLFPFWTCIGCTRASASLRHRNANRRYRVMNHGLTGRVANPSAEHPVFHLNGK